jgi:hypothetical protein
MLAMLFGKPALWKKVNGWSFLSRKATKESSLNRLGNRHSEGDDMAIIANPADLVGQDLSGFRVVEMTEIIAPVESLGFIEDEELAKAYAGTQEGIKCTTEKCLVLTNGNFAVLLTSRETRVKLLNIKKVIDKIIDKGLSKLTPIEQRIIRQHLKR